MILPTTNRAYKLLHDGVVALSEVEHNGIKIDVDYLTKTIATIGRDITELEEDIKKDEIYKVWRKRFGDKTKLDSTDQLGKVLFENFKFEAVNYTKGGKPKTDEAALDAIDHEFVKKYLRIKKLKKSRGTYLKGILRETDNGFVHPSFNLNMAVTYRSSSSDPNFQNMPIRQPEMSRLIRQCFIPRASNRHIVEADYSAIEVNSAAWYHKDPVMLDYLHDKTKDMHRDMAQQCYALPKSEMVVKEEADAKRIKNIRYCSKNKFVFPEFYGSWYFSCAPALWEAIETMKLHTRDGTSLRDYLKTKGISKLGSLERGSKPVKGTFMYHIKDVENDFWNNRFKVYKQWRADWYKDYQENLEFTTLTGFTISGIMQKNEVINYPVQGVAFHCLLWSLIRLQKLLKKYNMKSLIIGQIHDSIVADVVDTELYDYLQIANQVMTVDIKKHWNWIITPIEIEAEVAPVGKSWYEKKVMKIF